MVKCPECGYINPDGATGCGECGADLPKVDKEAPNTKSPNKKSSNTMIIAIIAIVVIIAIVDVFASGMLTGNSSGGNSQSVAPIVDKNTSDVNTQNSSSHNSASEFWASSKTDKFHLPTCEWAEKISNNNKVVYHSRDDAIADGKQPCTVCNP